MSMSRRCRIASLLGLGLAACSSHRETSAPTNVLLICADTLRSDHLGQNGYDLPTSPNLDAMAREGASFGRCISTYPQTAASVASILTGLYPSAHKVDEAAMQLSRVPVLLAEVLGDAGYQSAAVATNPHLTPGLGFERGFGRFIYIHGRNQARSSYAVPGQVLGDNISFKKSKGSYYGRGDDVNRNALSWLDARDTGRPFFLYLHYMDVHSPYVSPAPHQDMFIRGEGRNVYRNGLAKGRPSKLNRDFTRARYDGGVHYLDQCIGELRAGLEQRELWAETLLIFTADHGDEFMEHGGFGHGETLYREMNQVPLIFHGAGLSVQQSAQWVSTLDIFPTILDLLMLKAPAGLEGRSLKTLLQQNDAGGASPTGFAFAEGHALREAGREQLHGRGVSFYTQDWHLIQTGAAGGLELYDVAADPQERHDLAGQQPELARNLAERAHTLQAASLQRGANIQARQAILGEGTQAALGELGYGAAQDED